MKRKLSLFLATAMVTGALGACGGSSTTETTTAAAGGDATTTVADAGSETGDTTAAQTDNQEGGKVLTVQIGPNPETMDPALNSAVDGGNMMLHNFECLLVVNQEGKVVPGQAESFEVSDDGLTYTFHLREGLKWSDGSDLTANDFVYSWKRVCDPLTAAPYGETMLGMVEGYQEAAGGNLDALQVSAPDPLTFIVKLATPTPYFDSLVSYGALSPVQQATIEANGDAWAVEAATYVSNGAFYVTEWVPGSHITMSKNPYYWDNASIKLDQIKWLLMEDSNASYSAYQADEVSLIKDVPIEEINGLKGNPEFFVDPILGTYFLSVNTLDPAFEDPNVRKALSLAIDRDYVANTLMQGTYTPASNLVGTGWASDVDGTDFMDQANNGTPYIDTTSFEANLEQAKQLMADAGYPEGAGFPTVVYSTNDAAYHKVVAEYLQQAWGELGITVEVDIVEWASFTPMRRNGEYMISRHGWVADYNDPSNILDIFYSTNGNNDGKFNSTAFDTAMDESRTLMDKTERFAALHRAEDALMAETGCIPLAYYNDFWLQKPNITGSWHSPYGYWLFMYADIQ